MFAISMPEQSGLILLAGTFYSMIIAQQNDMKTAEE